jgi:ARP2/3 complex 20 kDa subunit (ARPC4)
MEDVDREISEMKLSLNARARIVAESYLTAVSFPDSSLILTMALTCGRFKVQRIVQYCVARMYL